MRKVEVMLVVIEVLRTVTKQFEKWIEKLDLDLTVEALFTWNGKNNVGSVGYELKKKATIPKTTGWCLLLCHFFTRK